MKMKKLFISVAFLAMLFPSNIYSQDQDIKKIKKYFKMDLQQLLNLVITTAGKKKEKISDIPASVVLVTREEIETYGYQTLAEIVENIPGLYITDDYWSQNTGIRGFWDYTSNRNIIILVNGIPLRNELSSSYSFENIVVPVEAIDRIEVVRGPMSVIYGNGAFFGVINIFTNQFDEKESVNQVSASIGSEKTSKLFVRTAGKQGDFQYVFNGSYFYTYGLDVPLSKMVSSPAILPYLGLSEDHTTEGQLERSEKFFNFSGTFKAFSFDTSYTETGKEGSVIFPSIADGTSFVTKDMRINVGYKKKLSNTSRLESKVCYFMHRYSADYDMLFEEFYGTQEEGAFGFRAALNLFITPSPKLDITMGMDYIYVQDVFNDVTVPAFARNLYHYRLADGEAIITQSIFAQIDYTLSDRLKFTAGAMLEQTPGYTLEERIGDFTIGNASITQATFSHPQVEFVPRIALIYSLNDRNIFKFLYGKAINRPSFFQNIDLLFTPDLPPLKPETIHTFEINYIAQLSSKFTMNLSVFRNILDKLIYRSLYIVDDTVNAYHANVGEMGTHGAEMTVICSPSPNLYFELSGTYQYTQDKRAGFEDIEVAYSPKFLGYLKASYFFNKNISLSVTGNYVSPMESYYDATLSPPTRLGEKVDGYFLLGANLRIRKLFGIGMFLNLRVSNLLDEEVRYPATANNFQFASKGTIGRGRSFLLTIGWKF